MKKVSGDSCVEVKAHRIKHAAEQADCNNAREGKIKRRSNCFIPVLTLR
jgi:hypothetical protein